MSNTSSKWYLVNTQAHQETNAELHLKRQGFVVYLPSFLRTRRHARRIDQVRKALFPGYLFIKEPTTGLSFSNVRGTYGVRKLVMQGSKPAQIDSALIKELQHRSNDDGLLDDPQLSPGAKVRFTKGPLTGLVAVLHTLNDQDRLTVLFDFLGKEMKKTVCRSNVILA
ncbi:transcription termination/antitermination protein NusG [Kiloniella majae]|uniref:transcription termination/antitermination protein NusG n=1 Tax=Kiloniella majae TaxID=1938558 RepID=UPI000A2791C5|nr:transcription termination/antitermination NusG family protein [Kiloniella majae]